MYVIRDPGVGLMPPEVWANPGAPSVPKAASMILPAGEQFVGDAMVAEGLAGAELAGGINWSQFGTDMLRQGIKDTTAIIGAGLQRVGRTQVQPQAQTPVHTVTGTRTPTPPPPVYVPPTPEKKGLPTWAWIAIGVGGVGVVGGLVWWFMRKPT